MAPPPAVPGIGARPTLPRQFGPVGGAPAVAPPSPPAPPPTPQAAPPGREPSKTGSRPVNPFLTHDPTQKARRLARALISDLAVYYPDRRKEGLANGTLKDLFKEEIQKSWEEYSEQVGKEVASSTTHFTDALNEILAGGQRVF
ncbi:MAG: hypothetical protein OEW80_04050 [Gemmatimonadota bacterium]|nr:hypothetical protein [Gemmatimonadota bacterium]